jgi:hypothetical protein
MESLSSQTLLNVAGILIALALGWTLLKSVAQVTFRLVAFGGLALLALAALVWVWVGYAGSTISPGMMISTASR